MDNYNNFLESKKIRFEACGFEVDKNSLNSNLFDFQRDIVHWSLKKGKCAIFAGTGLGKTLMELSWANQVHKHTNGDVLILAPLAVELKDSYYKQAVANCKVAERDINAPKQFSLETFGVGNTQSTLF